MNKLISVIDFGSQNLRIGIFDSQSKCIYSSIVKICNDKDSNNLEQSLKKLIKDAEKFLSIHLEDVVVLYDSSQFYFLDLSIRKTFDQPTFINKYYNRLIEEAKFVISENNFKDQIIHINVNKVVVNSNTILDKKMDNKKINSIILEIKFICLNKSLINNITNILKKNNLSISRIYCSSYTKTFFLKDKIEHKKNIIFLDIGFEKSSALIFQNDKLIFFKSIPIGGNNITKDISRVLKLDFDYSEDLKLKFNKNKLDNMKLFSDVVEKTIPIDLFKKIVEARLDEIIELATNDHNYLKKINLAYKPSLIFIGGGSKLFSNSYNVKFKHRFSKLIFFEESDIDICQSGCIYNNSDESLLTVEKKKIKKAGIFERFFNLFSN
tara:strand:+ start:1289 stop:2428 length:1140 start_codon:yes stop_codon:yes gene_type:complete